MSGGLKRKSAVDTHVRSLQSVKTLVTSSGIYVKRNHDFVSNSQLWKSLLTLALEIKIRMYQSFVKVHNINSRGYVSDERFDDVSGMLRGTVETSSNEMFRSTTLYNPVLSMNELRFILIFNLSKWRQRNI